MMMMMMMMHGHLDHIHDLEGRGKHGQSLYGMGRRPPDRIPYYKREGELLSRTNMDG
jgi:hypothetical protein